MAVTISLIKAPSNQSPTIKYYGVERTFSDGDFYCIKIDETIISFPIENIFNIKEEGGVNKTEEVNSEKVLWDQPPF
jgi:hypothetical protein